MFEMVYNKMHQKVSVLSNLINISPVGDVVPEWCER